MTSVLDRATAGFESPAGRREVDVALIGYQDQGNLGMGYLAAVLQARGYTVDMIEIRDGPERIGARLIAWPPLVVGFSLIFQFFLPQYRRVARHLRAIGIQSHFTIGGHYPSLCHDEVLTDFPELDSVARYEGEFTLVDLVQRLADDQDWRDVPGLAYLRQDDVVETSPRPLVQDLDSLPFPYRPFGPENLGGFSTLPLLASRGCARRCSFCSIHTFYRTAPGKVVRVRKPDRVVEEMLYLRDRYGVRVFLFQDDDFPLWGKVGRGWATELADRIHESGLARDTVWKISCRAEYVEPDLFSRLRDVGLFLIYMGIESGVEDGLIVLNKGMTVEQNLKGVQTLKDLGLQFQYGFMLFDPSSSFKSVRENVAFLRQIVGDGSAAATFCRMLPYGGTPIRELLRSEGRLRGDLTHPDYVFLDLRLNEYHLLLSKAARPWIHNTGLSHQLNYAWDELEMVRRLVPTVQGYDAYQRALRALTASSNERLFRLVEASSAAFECGDPPGLDPVASNEICKAIGTQLAAIRNRFIADNLDVLLGAAGTSCTDGPVMAPGIH